MAKRQASARWDGSLTDGNGTMRMATGAFEGPLFVPIALRGGEGGNPEELIAAAHAGLFLDGPVGGAGPGRNDPESVETDATVHLEKVEGGFAISRIRLSTRVCRGISDDEFQEIANAAKHGCPVSQALAGVDSIELDARLVEDQ